MRRAGRRQRGSEQARWARPLAYAVETGRDASPKPQSGDRRSARIEAPAAVVLTALERQPNITLADLRDGLARCGIGISVAGLGRYFQRRRITLERPAMQPSRTGPTS